MINKAYYQTARNDYGKMRKEEKRNYEKDIVNKCKEQPKLFYRYINGKLKNKEVIEKLKGDNRLVEDPKDMAELLNNKFQQVFTKEPSFTRPHDNGMRMNIKEIKINKNEIYKMMKELV